MLSTLDNIKSVKGIGDKTAALFNKIGISTVGDLLSHYPFRYETFSYPLSIACLKDKGQVIVQGYISQAPKTFRLNGKAITTVNIRDNTGSVLLKWFNSPYIKNTLRPGSLYVFKGVYTVSRGQNVIVQPKIYTEAEYRALLNTLLPVYPVTEGLSQNAVRKACKYAIENTKIVDYLPSDVKKRYGLLSLKEGFAGIHNPSSEEGVTDALKRMIFDEFLFFFINLRSLKNKDFVSAPGAIINKSETADTIIKSLPFEMTTDQVNAYDEICKDLSGGKIMQRLLQGDVGSGKTVVALLSLVNTVKSGYQGCILAPTEVLAKQHYEYFVKELAHFGIKCALLISNIKASEKKAVYEGIADGSIDIVIGTHAAISEKVSFKNLALCVIDEQHRFGVRQREAIMLKGENPHVLLMSATPIPRTYALMLYGDMDVSVIKSMPVNRLPIKNLVADENMRERVYRFILKEIKAGHQAYIICPLVEESEKMSAAAVTNYVDLLADYFDDSIKIEIMHGKLKADVKNDIMDRYSRGEINILVSTTVIEVGVNVPNSTVILIENSENFGLAQLHQMRGRVGRGGDQSYCIFMTGKTNEKIKERMDIIAGSNDGFYIASQDMKTRGPGDFFGVRQSGERQFILADTMRDTQILEIAKECSENLDNDTVSNMLEIKKSIVSDGECMVY